MKYCISCLIFFLASGVLFAQDNGVIKGIVYDEINKEPIPLSIIVIQGTSKGSQSDFDGKFEIKGLKPDLYTIEISSLGYKKKILFEIQVTNAKESYVEIALQKTNKELEEVVIRSSPFNKTQESPVSLRTIGAAEIERNPGGNRDISKVIQSLPGVASPPTFRNDIIIRGGAPNENRFYLDGVEVPNINHFATQGSSGGPVGLINVNFIREVDFYSGAFPATRGNALSSVFEFKQKDGNKEKLNFMGVVGASDIGLTADGPIGEKTTYIFSVRRSYLQFLFKALDLPFLPIYNDAQFKVKSKVGKKGELSFIGLGAFDDFELNTEANETELQQYILNGIPANYQWNYTIGSTYRHFRDNSYATFVLSRNHLNNTSEKYFNNDNSSPDNLILDYNSAEIENKFRYEEVFRKNGYKLTYGLGLEQSTYTNDTYNKISIPSGVVELDFESELSFYKYALFTQLSRGYLDERLNLSLGLRADANTYSSLMQNPFEQFSPRFSASYTFAEKYSLNFNVGRYYQLPAYTVLGYRDSLNQLVNKNNGVKFIKCDHVVAGIEYTNTNNLKVTVEGFYKDYDNYPFLLNDSISLANLGADFGVIGNAPVNSSSSGRSYGIEFLLQQKLYKGFYGIVAYTLVRSEFSARSNELKPSAWDNRHIVTLTGGKKFKKDWELGIKWRFLGGAPFTPIDVQRSSLIPVWDVTGAGIPDYDNLNSKRLPGVHQLDVRVDKKVYLKNLSMNFYFDVQNIYNFQAELAPYLTVERDNNGDPIVDPTMPGSYKTYFIDNIAGTLLPSLGIIIEF